MKHGLTHCQDMIKFEWSCLDIVLKEIMGLTNSFPVAFAFSLLVLSTHFVHTNVNILTVFLSGKCPLSGGYFALCIGNITNTITTYTYYDASLSYELNTQQVVNMFI